MNSWAASCMVFAVVPPAEASFAVLEVEQAIVGDGDAMRVLRNRGTSSGPANGDLAYTTRQRHLVGNFEVEPLNGPNPFWGSRPRTTLRVTDNNSNAARSWKTVAIPSWRASVGSVKTTDRPQNRSSRLSGGTRQDLDECRHAGAILALQGENAARVGLQRNVNKRSRDPECF
jgi:hypothetical protein